jgi:hypothetical protein
VSKYNTSEIDQMFQQHLGRNGTSAEHSFLKDYIDQGVINPYQIDQYLQGTPEAMQSRMGQQGQQYQDLLAKNNQQILGQAADAANASFAQNGRQFSSGQGNAVIQAGQQLASQQSPAIAAFYGNNFNGLNQAYSGAGQGALQRAYGLQDANTQHAWDMQNFYMQKDATGDMLNTQNRQNFQNGLIQGGFGLLDAGAKGFGMGAGMAAMSDRRVKKNISPAGEKNGHRLYEFEYRADEFPHLDLPKGKQVGVMADEVEKYAPQAVGERGGYKTVNYSALGLA